MMVLLMTAAVAQHKAPKARPRASDLGLKVGILPTGPLDAITIKKLGTDLAEIERGIRELSKQPHPNQKRMEFWTREAVKLREEIATISGEDNGARHYLKPRPSRVAPKPDEPTNRFSNAPTNFTSSAEGQTVTISTIGFSPSLR